MEINLWEWHRLRIVNTNMAYLEWQLNIGESELDEAFVQPDECQVWLLGTDGINFETGPRFVYNPPYNGSVVIPPGGRADLMVVCFEDGLYTAFATNNTRSEDTLFENAPLPSETHAVMHFVVRANSTNYTTANIIYPIPCTNASSTEIADCDCYSWDTPELPCSPVPYDVSPYLANTTGMTYPDVTAQCNSPHSSDDMKLSCLLSKIN